MNLVHSFQIKPTWRLVPNSTSTKENKKSFAPGSEIPTSQHDVFDFRSWLKVEFLNHDVRLQVSSLLIFFLACPLRLVQNSVVLLCCTMQKRSLQQMPWYRLFRRDMYEQYVLQLALRHHKAKNLPYCMILPPMRFPETGPGLPRNLP